MVRTSKTFCLKIYREIGTRYFGDVGDVKHEDGDGNSDFLVVSAIQMSFVRCFFWKWGGGGI